MKKLLRLFFTKVNGRVKAGLLMLSAFCLSQIAFAQYAVNGNAAQISCNCYRLTPDANSQSGSVWNLNQINLYNSFDYVFDTYFGSNDGGADGIGFVLQPISTTIGSSGGGMGFAGISPSWAVEMDTYQNGGDPGFDHMAIMKNGDVYHPSPNNLAGPVQMSANSGNVEDGAWHSLRVIWDASSYTMLVYFDGILRLNHTYDLVSNIFGGNPNVYWGFTAATGGARNEHRFCVGLNPVVNSNVVTACVGEEIQFLDNSFSTLGDVQSWSWNFGDGQTSSDQNPTHAFSSPGTKTVTLIINDINGCSASTTYDVNVVAAPNVSAGPDVSVCDGGSTTLSGSGAGTYSWSPATGLDNPAIASPTATPASTTTYTLTVSDQNGCSASDDVVVTVNPLPTAEFTATDECLGEVTQFTDQSSTTFGTISSYNWDFDDSNSSTSANPTHTYQADNTYNVTLTVTATGGCTSSITHPVQVFAVPVVDFTFTDECFNVPITFNDQSSISNNGTIAQWDWDFAGDGTSTDQNPSHNFSSDGQQMVTLEVTSTDGCVNSVSRPVTVFPLPEAAFSAPDECFGKSTSFTDLSTISSGSVDAWAWDFGDGGTSNQSDPTHTYLAPNTYSVELTVTSDNNCTSTVIQDVVVSVNPTADFTFTEACETDDASFTSTSTIAQGSITSWEWDFGDSGTSIETDPLHPYTTAGTYTVELIVSTDAGCADTIEHDIDVHPYPTAAFTATTECFGNTTVFTDGSSVNGDVISNWQWNFGVTGGTASTGNPTYDYSAAGVYDVTLTVTTANSCSATISNTVEVYATPVAEFENDPVCHLVASEFSNTSTIDLGSISTTVWDFGVSGGTSNASDPTYTYIDAGSYTVELVVTSDNGCTDEVSHQVVVHPLPEVEFSSSVIEGCVPLDVQFVDNSVIQSGNIVSYQWDLGDGPSSESSLSAPSYKYEEDGTYDVGLILTSDQGCVDSVRVTGAITVYPLPAAAFKVDPQPTNLYQPEIEFTNVSTGSISWDWDFGDFTFSTEESPVHEYQDSGTYIVSLISYTEYGCADTAESPIRIDPIFTLFIPTAFTPDSDGINDKFYVKGVGIVRFKMRIFDRWGQQVFTGYNVDEGWDGSDQTTGIEMQQDVYVYRIILQEISGLEHEYAGKIQLVR